MVSNALTMTILLGLALVTVLPASTVAADLPSVQTGLDWGDCLQSAANGMVESIEARDPTGWASPDEPYCRDTFDSTKP